MLDKYEIISEIEGNKLRKFSSVYCGKCKKTKKKVFIKIIHKEKLSQTNMFMAENEANFSFDFQGLPNVIENINNEKNHIIVFEWIDGLPLNQLFKQKKRGDQFKLLKKITEKFLLIQSYLNQYEIIHLDIKPSNLLYNDRTEQLFLIDFGMATFKNDLKKRSTLFSLPFASPELILNQVSLFSQKSDAYSFAYSLWVLMEGKYPFQATNPSIYTNMQVNLPLPNLTDFQKSISQLFQQLSFKSPLANTPSRLGNDQLILHLEKDIAQRMELSEFNEKLKEINFKKWFFF